VLGSAIADDHQATAALFDLGLLVTQLRDLLVAEQSAEVPDEAQDRWLIAP
jgi:hypothetical protein